MPNRIQRKRTKGWKMPEGAVYVGRPAKWGNQFRSHTKWYAVDQFRKWLDDSLPGQEIKATIQRELRGKNLVCWCPLDNPCHADVLLEIANA